MTTEPIRLERRVGQRFEVNIPITLRTQGRTIPAFSQNVSSRGVFLYCEEALPEGQPVELTFTMPSEITLAESMRMRCAGRILRCADASAGQKTGLAVHLDSYEYLTDSASSAAAVTASSGDPMHHTSPLVTR